MRKKWSHTLTLVGFTALALIPLVTWCNQGEQERWRAAAAMHAYDQGDTQTAIDALRASAKKLPKDPFVQQTLVSWLCENGDATEGLAICNAMLEQSPDSAKWLNMKLMCEGRAGRFDDALATYQQWQGHSPRHVKRDREELNGSAYHRALANRDLALAAAEIESAIDRELSIRESGFQLPLPEKTTIATALLSRHCELQHSVLPILNQQIEEALQWEAKCETQLVDQLLATHSTVLPFPKKVQESLDSNRIECSLRRRTLAFLVATRALLFEDLGEQDRCDIDRSLLMDLGYAAQDVVDQLPDDLSCLAIAGGYGMQFLDTRGFVRTRLPWHSAVSEGGINLIDFLNLGPLSSYEMALRDLDIAVAASLIAKGVSESSPDLDPRRRADLARVHAVLLYHRSLAHERAGETAAQESDRQAIVALGFEPGPHLF